ncbi:MAG: RodZ domain-containing protein [Bdellovibrionales bacterium]
MSKNKNRKNDSSDPSEEEGVFTRADSTPKTKGSEDGYSESAPPEKEVRVVLSEPRQSRQRTRSDSIGDLLRETRLRRGDDLYQIAEYLCIKPAFLIALENNRYDEFPADAYVIGFLRTYASFLGIDGKEAVDRYRYEMAGRRKKPILSMPIPMSEGRAPSAIVLISAAAALIFIYSVWYNLSSPDRDKARVPPPLPTATQTIPAPGQNPDAAAGLTAPMPASAPVTPLQQEAVPAAPAAASSAPSSTPAPATSDKEKKEPQTSAVVIPPASPGIVVVAPAKDEIPVTPKKEAKAEPKEEPKTEKKTEETTTSDGEGNSEEQKPLVFGDTEANARIIIHATQNSWIMIADDSGRTLFDRVLKPGESYKVPNQTGLALTTSNGSGITLSLDGKDLPKIAKGPPRMVRNIMLDPNLLASGSAIISR